MQTLKNKVAVVTGGTRGIGYSIAEALVKEEARVFVCGRKGAEVKKAVDSLAGLSSEDKAGGAEADVSRYEDCRRLIRAAADRFGGIDILVNNAGVGIFNPIDQLKPEDWDAVIGTNLSGVFYCCREAIPLMRQRGGGYIFNISSLAGVNAFPGGSAYNASKFGLNGFSEAMMQEIRYDGIRVSYIMPGSVATDFAAAPGARPREAWKLTGEDVAKALIDLYKFPATALASRIELRPSQPPKKK
ncbi:MAG: SDR family oxidoreductase [Acidobacteriota bacterium]|nr:SDR family oxidoreductase [Acidobacteriota bacterium]